MIPKNPKKLKKCYSSDLAQEHQEIHTPKELIDRIKMFVSEDDFAGDVLDPCVGPGACTFPFMEYGFKTFTVCDIQTEHIENMKIYLEENNIKFKEEIDKNILDEW